MIHIVVFLEMLVVSVLSFRVYVDSLCREVGEVSDMVQAVPNSQTLLNNTRDR